MPKLCDDSGDKPRVLILSPESPWPMHGGGAIRTASLVEYFSSRASLDLIIFGESSTHLILPRHRRDPLSRALRNLRRSVQGTPPLIDRFSGFERELSARLAGRHYDLIIIEHFWCAPYAPLLRHFTDELWLDLHNLESEWHETLARYSSPLIGAALRRFAHSARRLERELLPLFDLVLVPSERPLPGTQVLVYPNALPWIEPPRRSEESSIIFTGNLEYQPNIDAIRFFLREVWPELRQRHPRLRWRIAGRNAGAVARMVRGCEGIDLIGPVDNAIAELAKTKVSVVPLRAGSGTRLKILEAWAAGTPVVSTTLGAQGLDAEPGRDLLIADDARAFADTISALFSSVDQCARLSASGRRLYERRFTWAHAWNLLTARAPETMSKMHSLYTG